MDLFDETQSFFACSPKTFLTARVSVRSLRGVDVPWALM